MFRTSDDEPVGLGTLFVRWGIGGILIVVGIVLFAFNVDGFGVDGFALGAGAGGSVIMINWLFRVGVTGDKDREREEAARRFLEVHGYWPDERPPPRPAGPGA
jgi:hypothetical protein